MSEFNDMMKAFGKELFKNEYQKLWYLDWIKSILGTSNMYLRSVFGLLE